MKIHSQYVLLNFEIKPNYYQAILDIQNDFHLALNPASDDLYSIIKMS